MNNKFFQFLGLTKKAGNVLEGYNRCEEALNKARIFLFILSAESSENTKDKFRRYCEENNIPFIQGCSSERLGLALGKPEINVLCITNKGMSKKLLQLWEECN